MSRKPAAARKKIREDNGPLREPIPPFAVQHQQSPGLESKLDPRPRYEAEAYKAAAKLNGKIALITGGDSGIGRAVAVLFAREGANVAINYLSVEESDAKKTRQEIQECGQTCLLLPGDISEPETCDELVEKTIGEFGRLDILVSNAAFQRRTDQIEDLSDEDLEYTFNTNILAYIRLARAAAPRMKAGGVIIATSSETSIFGSEKLPDYSATKGAINAFTKTLAHSLLERGIRVNAVAPGPVWTPLNPSDGGLAAKDVATFGSKNPMGRPAQPEELAPAYVFLASNADSSYITGTVLHVMGGETSGG
jgi:NAD(P)-dependent dehydrogenase (short-subunit alcohol dehydrogenase family)